jgi:tRNA A37 threonylcarbamoyladenosine dehydratase
MNHEELYRGVQTLRNLQGLPIIVCGVGAIGSNLVDNLICHTVVDHLTVIDFDRVEKHNRQNQIYTLEDVGSLKTTALQAHIFRRSLLHIVTITKKLDASNVKKLIMSSTGLVVDAFDNADSRRVLYEHCSVECIPCLHVGLAADFAEIKWNEVYKLPGDSGIDVCEYAMAKNIISLAVIVASEVILRFVETKCKLNYEITLKDLKVSQV